MTRHVADLRDVSQGHLDLGASLLLHLFDVPFILQDGLAGIGFVGAHHREEVAVLVAKRGAMGERAPLHVLPFAGERQVKAHVDAGILL